MILTRDGKEIVTIYRQDGSEVEEVKDANGRLVYSASREIVGDLPLRYSGRGKPLTDYLISGNTVQDGTPSADAPVEVQGSGVRTGNLWDEDYTGISGSLKYVPVYVGNGSFTLSTSCSVIEGAAALFFLAGNVQSGASTVSNGVYKNRPITVASSNGYVTVVYRYIATATGNADPRNEKTMLNLGSTSLPYEPYGFKLPLTVNGTEYPIYLGTVPTTRRIGKFDLSELSWTRISNGLWKTTGIPNIKYVSANTEVGDGIAEKYAIHAGAGMSTALGYIAIDVSQVSVNTGDASETPTGMFWYVLAEPETGIVNEPLMKIGDYADTISFAQAGVTIPTVNGANVLDMASTVKPSEVYIKGKGIKPTGYGQLTDVNGVNVLDKDGTRILVHGQ